MDESLQAYEVNVGESSLEPTAANEGTNASRFAIMAALGDGTVDGEAPPDSVVTRENMARFGLNPELLVQSRVGDRDERRHLEAMHLLGVFRPGQDLSELRYQAFADLNGSAASTARLALLAAGVCSHLERESVTAGSAILTSVALEEPEEVPAHWGGWPFPFLDRRSDTFRLGGPQADFNAPPDEDDLPPEVWPWDSGAWPRYSSYWLDDAISAAEPARLLTALRFLAQVRVDLGRRSPDPIVRELALAPFLHLGDDGADPPSGHVSGPLGDAATRVSTMVHGTWGWKGDWWYHGGDFHSFVRGGIRPNVYDGGQEFSWSGAYSKRQRVLGAQRFHRWAVAAGGAAGLGTVFAHSYGAELVARAVNDGALVDEVVLLSAPVHQVHRQMLGMVRHVVDVRLEFDIVLTAARAAQRLPNAANVDEHVLGRPFWSHGATHDPDIWSAEGIAAATGLQRRR